MLIWNVLLKWFNCFLSHTHLNVHRAPNSSSPTEFLHRSTWVIWKASCVIIFCSPPWWHASILFLPDLFYVVHEHVHLEPFVDICRCWSSRYSSAVALVEISVRVQSRRLCASTGCANKKTIPSEKLIISVIVTFFTKFTAFTEEDSGDMQQISLRYLLWYTIPLIELKSAFF